MERYGGVDLRAGTLLREYTINRPVDETVGDLLRTVEGVDKAIVGLGVYIWNVTQTFEVVRALKAARPDVVIVLGGPEVSHELETQPIVALADHVITGWGDVSFPQLCRSLVHGPQPLMKVIAGEQPPLDALELPYGEYSSDDIAHRVVYVEASRGCPFRCEFCLSSLDRTAWSFPQDAFMQALETLWQRGVRHFKFVDRTFNLKIDASARILEFFLAKLPAPGAGEPDFMAHFEVIPDHLPDRLKALLAQFPPGTLQLEVGIQTFNVDVQKRISRKQDNARTQANLRWLAQESAAHLHADLIFGLPGETLESFAIGFDTLWALGPHEIQLGILKRLRGTPIARHTQAWGMVYDIQAPYTVQATAQVSAQTMQEFIRFARFWDLIANSGRFARTLPLLLGDAPFANFWRFSRWLWEQHAKTVGWSPDALVDVLFAHMVSVRGLGVDAVRTALLADYADSGAHVQPLALQGLLPPVDKSRPSRRGAAKRQQRHLAPG
jgi:tRNA A37 methylthiotransferase MiaB